MAVDLRNQTLLSGWHYNWKLHYFLFFILKGTTIKKNSIIGLRWTKTYSCFQIYQWIILTSLTVQQSCNHRHTNYKPFKLLYWRYIVLCLPNKTVFEVEDWFGESKDFVYRFLRPGMNGEQRIVLLGAHPQSQNTLHCFIGGCCIGTRQVLSDKKKTFLTKRVTKTKWNITNNPGQMCIPPGNDSGERWECQCRSRSRMTADSWRGAPQNDNRLQSE